MCRIILIYLKCKVIRNIFYINDDDSIVLMPENPMHYSNTYNYRYRVNRFMFIRNYKWFYIYIYNLPRKYYYSNIF